MNPTRERVPDETEDMDALVLAFAPIHKRALGMAVGLVIGSLVFFVTAWGVLVPEPPAMLYLLGYFLPGHDVTWPGALRGAISAGFASFVAAWFLAFSRNFFLAASVWLARTRAELSQTRDFLDHI
jgi:hypothetical protein